MIITTSGFIKRGSLQPLFDALKDSGIQFVVYSEVKPDPTTVCIEEALAVYTAHNCEVIIAVGGGSVIDCAKMVGARVACPRKSVREMAGLLKIRSHIPTLYAVPTTAGTGSEVTAGAVVTDETNHYKYTVLDLSLVPHYAILDPSLTLSLPQAITAATGMDALTHAVEAYTNRFTSRHIREVAKEAVRLIFDNLILAYRDGQDLQARENLLLASYYAGQAINKAFVGYVHALAHAVGGMYGVTHGVANAVILPRVLQKYGTACEREVGELTDAIQLGGKDDREKMQRFITAIENLNETLNLPANLSVIQEKDIPELTKRALREANPTYPVPRIWTERDFEEVLKTL